MLIDKLVKLSTSFLYFENLHIKKKLLIPRVQKVVWLLNLQLVLNKRIHPKNMVILPFKLQLITNQIWKLTLCLDLKLIKYFFKQSINLLFNMCCFGVYLFNFQVNFWEILCKLILSSLNIRIDFLNFGRNLWICIFQLNQSMFSHFTSHVITEDFTVDTKSFSTNTTI